jgi:hypothetical protein
MKKVFSPILGHLIEDIGQDLTVFGIVKPQVKPKIHYVKDKQQRGKRNSSDTK